MAASWTRQSTAVSFSSRWQLAGRRSTRYPFTRKVAAQLPKHDDRAEYLAGIDRILADHGLDVGAARSPCFSSHAARLCLVREREYQVALELDHSATAKRLEFLRQTRLHARVLVGVELG
jgi:hypothetical protein